MGKVLQGSQVKKFEIGTDSMWPFGQNCVVNVSASIRLMNGQLQGSWTLTRNIYGPRSKGKPRDSVQKMKTLGYYGIFNEIMELANKNFSLYLIDCHFAGLGEIILDFKIVKKKKKEVHYRRTTHYLWN